jgi:hypothetical protein
MATATVLALGVFGVSAASAATLTVCESGLPTCGYSSIQAAANAASSGDTIEIAAGTYSDVVFIEKNLTLQGAGAERTIIDGDVDVFVEHPVVTITGVTVANHHGVLNEGGTVTLSNSVVKNSSKNGGGGIDNFGGGTVTLNNSTVSDNSARHFQGGGISNEEGGTVTLNNSTVSDNHAPRGGGGIANEEGGTVTLRNSTVSGNSASGTATAESSGGGIYNKSGTVTLSNTKVSGNTAEAKGGGIYNKATVMGSNDAITGNTAPEGAGIFNEPLGEVKLTNSKVQSP